MMNQENIIQQIEDIIQSDKSELDKKYMIGNILNTNDVNKGNIAKILKSKNHEGYGRQSLYDMENFYEQYKDKTEELEFAKTESWKTNLKWLKDKVDFETKFIEYKNSAKKNQLISINGILIKNFNGIIETQITDIQNDTQWIFLVSENGFGKSSVLQAIYCGLCGIMDGDTKLISDKNKIQKSENITIELDFTINNITHKHILSGENNYEIIDKFEIKNVFAYGANRLNFKESSNVAHKATPAYNLFRTDGLFLDIQETVLTDWYRNDKQKYHFIKSFLTDLLKPYITDIEIKENQFFYSESDTETKEVYQKVEFAQLASGFKSIVAMFGDLLLRFDKLGQDFTKPESLKGIVLIDEFELFWHPKLQKSLVKKMSEIFKNVQFVVATHSVATIMGAPQNSIFLKEERTKEEGITINKIDIDTTKLSPNIIMSSPLIDMPL